MVGAASPDPDRLDWLDLATDLVAQPPARWPAERIGLRLVRTFGAQWCTFHVWTPRAHVVEGPWPAERVAVRWGGDRLRLPVQAAPRASRAFVVGRREAFTDRDQELGRHLCRLLGALDRDVRSRAPSADHEPLTPRELAVLALMAEGRTAGSIGRKLAISERTVHKHLERTYAKLGVTDRLSAVLHAQRAGLLPVT
ncbi:hypothetical protein BJF78_23490 [Pseudonocardia sp. CNS-139]|nr:hypothetical protein BJF78_23490 [Pseudonocardia sp. CNS-139]